MNPAILKVLIISGGTIGLGVPSIYYGYPHIAKLVSPVVEEDQTASGGKIQEAKEETEAIKVTEDRQENPGGGASENVPNTKEQGESNSPSSGVGNSGSTNPQGTDTPSQGSVDSKTQSSVNGQNATGGTGETTITEPQTQVTNRSDNSSRRNQN